MTSLRGFLTSSQIPVHVQLLHPQVHHRYSKGLYYWASGVKNTGGTGKWWSAGNTASFDCTAEYFSDAATTYLKVCPAWTYSAAGQSSCTNASGGY